MEYIRFGATGLKVSRICLGCMSCGRPTERRPWALDDAVAALSVQLTPDEIRHLEEAYQPHPVLGFS